MSRLGGWCRLVQYVAVLRHARWPLVSASQPGFGQGCSCWCSCCCTSWLNVLFRQGPCPGACVFHACTSVGRHCCCSGCASCRLASVVPASARQTALPLQRGPRQSHAHRASASGRAGSSWGRSSCSPGTGLRRAGRNCGRSSYSPGTGLSRAGSICGRSSCSPGAGLSRAVHARLGGAGGASSAAATSPPALTALRGRQSHAHRASASGRRGRYRQS